MTRLNSPQNISIDWDGNVLTILDNAGNQLALFSRVVASGTFVANGAASVTVGATSILAGDEVSISLNTVGGTVGALPTVKTLTAGTGFTTAGTASDTSTYNYKIRR